MTLKNFLKIKENIKNIKVHTFPQEDVGAIGGAAAFSSCSNSSARPHEQFLQAFLFPLVSQSGP